MNLKCAFYGRQTTSSLKRCLGQPKSCKFKFCTYRATLSKFHCPAMKLWTRPHSSTQSRHCALCANRGIVPLGRKLPRNRSFKKSCISRCLLADTKGQSVQELTQHTLNLIEDVWDDGSWENKTSFFAKMNLNFQRNRLAWKTCLYEFASIHPSFDFLATQVLKIPTGFE